MTDDIETKCKHTSIEYDVGGLAQPGTNVMLTDIAARCADCGVTFKWLGRWSNKAQHGLPYVSEDGVWLSLPMIPEDENVFRLILNEELPQ